MGRSELVHAGDSRTYDKTCHAGLSARAGSVKDVKWTHVKVGQVLKVYDDEDFPADLLCLFCNLADNVCYIKTTGLDGAELPANPLVGFSVSCLAEQTHMYRRNIVEAEQNALRSRAHCDSS